MSASRPFQVFAKPAGAQCNMECRYCYYLEKQAFGGPGQAPRMSDDLLERYVVQHIDAAPEPEVTFSWHGGEPTTLGTEYFRRVVALQRRHGGTGHRVLNGIQTNGLLIDEAWCRFLAAEGFRVGLSLDGPAPLHDCYRVTRGGEGTHGAAVRAFHLLARHGVPTDILCVVHDRNVRQPLDVYRYFREIGVRSLGLLPLVERTPGGTEAVSDRSVPAEAYGEFLCAVFDRWAARDRDRIAVQLFDEATRPARGLDHSLCVFRETCGDVPVVEHNGDVYSCDHFVDAEHRLGNIAETPLGGLLEKGEQLAFGEAKRDLLPGCCRRCEVLAICNGGCPKDRFIRSRDDEPGLNYLCPAFKRFFAHIRPFARSLAAEGSRTLTLDDALRAVGAPAGAALGGGRRPGRNDPCPCGSGRKYKQCCGR